MSRPPEPISRRAKTLTCRVNSRCAQRDCSDRASPEKAETVRDLGDADIGIGEERLGGLVF